MEPTNSPFIQPAQTEPQSALVHNFAIPIAIVVAGLAIAAAIYFGDGSKKTSPASTFDAVTKNDHILGNPKAKVMIVEYSDLECPFCKVFHKTMTQVMNEYGESGDVAWVYRHFPIASLHPKADKEAQATECVAKIGGNQKFWEYTNKIFSVTPSNNGLDLELLPKIAEELGIDKTAFLACLESGEMQPKSDAGLASGKKAGVRGTPHSLIVVNGKVVDVIGGAQPFTVVKQMIDSYLKKEGR